MQLIYISKYLKIICKKLTIPVPLQAFLFGASSWPGGHSHRKLPGVLMHTPPRQSPGMRSHSLISATI